MHFPAVQCAGCAKSPMFKEKGPCKVLLPLGSLVTCQQDEGFSTGVSHFCLQTQTNKAKPCLLLEVRRMMQDQHEEMALWLEHIVSGACLE